MFEKKYIGAVSWAITSITIGPFLDKIGYEFFFYIAPIAGILSIITLIKYYYDSSSSTVIFFDKEYYTSININNDDEAINNNTYEEEEIELTTKIRKYDKEFSSDEKTTCYNDFEGEEKAVVVNNDDDEEEENPNDDNRNSLLLLDSKINNNNDNKKQANNDDNKNDDDSVQHSLSMTRKNVMSLFFKTTSSCIAIGFIICTLALNMGTSIVESLIFLYFQDTLGGSNTICGFTVLVTVVFEIPIFYYTPKLLDYYTTTTTNNNNNDTKGAEVLQIIACLAYIVRVVGYTFIPKNHIVLPLLLLEPLHGVTYACSQTSTVDFAAKKLSFGGGNYEATGQSIMSLIRSFGSVLGLCLGGWMEDTVGPKTLYRSYAAIVTVGLVLFTITINMDYYRRGVKPTTK